MLPPNWQHVLLHRPTERRHYNPMGCKTKTKTLGLINKASANHKFSMLYDKDETKPLGSALVNSRQPRRHFAGFTSL